MQLHLRQVLIAGVIGTATELQEEGEEDRL